MKKNEIHSFFIAPRTYYIITSLKPAAENKQVFTRFIIIVIRSQLMQ